MRQAIAIVFEVLALASCAGAYALEHFTKVKLGMTRWVNYNSTAIKQIVPIDVIYIACTVLLAVLLIGLLAMLARSQKRAVTVVAAVFAAVLVILLALAATRLIRTAAYVFTTAALLLGALFALGAGLLFLCKQKPTA